MRKLFVSVLTGLLSCTMATNVAAQTYAFSHCGASGKNGPTQALVNASYGAGHTLNGAVTVTNNGVQQWTVPATGLYRITMAGASGGTSTYSVGGGGVAVQSDISLTAGQVLNIVVGQAGQSNAGTTQFVTGGSGGGGSFIYQGAISGNGLLMAAGGGGGGLSSATNAMAANVSNGNFNTYGYSITDAGAHISYGGINGAGGGFSGRAVLSGGGGSGWISDADITYASGGAIMGGTRFTGGTTMGAGRDGGFGGGGASGDVAGYSFGWSGGGGGYSGGAGGHNGGNADGQVGGGGGSFFTGTGIKNLGFNNGNGYVTFSFMALPARALNFDGQNDHIRIADKNNLRIGGGNFSVEFWARPTVVDGNYHWVISKDNGNTNLDFLAGIDASNKWRFVSRNMAIDIIGGQTIVANNWYHVACTVDGSIATLYVNGIAVGTSPAPAASTSNTADIIIGGRTASAVTQMFAGDMDEVRIWNRALCAGELDNNRNCELGNGQSGLLAYYTFNAGFINSDNSGIIVATDLAGNGNNGTLTGFALAGSVSNWVAGTINGSCSVFAQPQASAVAAGPTTFCADSQVVLTASEGASYVWSNGATARSITVNTTGSYTAIVTNSAGCKSSTNAIAVTVNPLPVVTIANNGPLSFCPGGSVELSASAGSSYAWSNAATTQSVTINTAGSYTVQVTDVNGCRAASAATIVTVRDIIAPSITAPANIAVNTDAGSCAATAVVLGSPVVSDNCGVASVVNNAPVSYPAGTTTVTWTVTDNNGNTNTATQTVTVKDNEKPSIKAPAKFSVVNTPGICVATISNLGAPTSSDNCGIATVSNDHPSSIFPVGTTIVTWTVTDIHGNITDTAKQAVTVVDNEPPSILVNNKIVSSDAGLCGAIINLDAPVVSDNCGIASVTNDHPNNFYPVGTTQVSWTVTDTHGWTKTTLQAVTVTDTEKPTVHAPAPINILNDAGQCSAAVNIGMAVVSDNCGVASVTNDHPSANYPVGTTVVTWTVTDIHGNSATATQTITIRDTEKPRITAPARISVVNDEGKCGATIQNLGTPVATDNCGVASVSNDHSGNFFPVGTTIITWRATDIYGNVTDTAKQSITVIDNERPTITVNNVHVTNASGQCGATVVLPAPVVSDNCGIAAVTNDHPGNFFPVGVTLVKWTVTDNHGWTAHSTQTITVTDTEKPSIIAPATISVVNDAGLNGANISSLGIPVTADNCGVASVSNDHPSGFYPMGTTVVTWYVTDVNGITTDTAKQLVIVTDSELPTISVTNMTVQADAGNCSATIMLPAPLTTDNNGVASVTNDHPSNLFPVGVTNVTWTVTDNQGLTNTAVQQVRVTDNEKPIVLTKSLTLRLDASGNASVTAAQVNNGSTDNCGIASMALDKTVFGCADRGANTITLTVTDIHGNTASQTAVINVMDDSKPVVITRNITIYLDATGRAGLLPSQVDNGSTDNCSIAAITLDRAQFDCSHLGANTITLTVTDASGNADAGTAVVTLADSSRPVVRTQNVTIYLGADGTAQLTAAQVNSGSTDNCAIASLVLDKTNFNCSDIGLHTVLLTVTDGSGNFSSATAVVTVADSTAPVVHTRNLVLALGADGRVSVNASQINKGSTDNCGVSTVAIDKNSFDCAHAGNNMVILTVTDASGNTASGTAMVTITDNTKPVVLTRNITVKLGSDGKASVSPSQIDAGSYDHCAIASVVLDKSVFACGEVGSNTVWLTVTDVNGNSESRSAVVTVVDSVAPVVDVQPVVLPLGSDGKATLTPGHVNNGSVDNCAIASVEIDKTIFSCADLGENSVTLTVTDIHGNSSSRVAVVTVVDTAKPVVITRNITVSLGADGTVLIDPTQLNNGSSDNCGVASVTLDKNRFNCSETGVNTVILTVTDINGNSQNAGATVFVTDDSKPLVRTKETALLLDANGKAMITASQVDNGSSDNCGIATMGLDKTTFDCTSIGANTVILTVTDIHGNVSSGIATITVKDSLAPTVITRNIRVILGADGTAQINAADIDNGSTDNCSILSLAADKTTFTCADMGTHTVILTVTDPYGNASSAPATVTVIDDSKPVVITRNKTVNLNASGQAIVNASQIDAGSADNCGVAAIALDKTNFTCNNTGANTVLLTVTDASGNSSSATATVTVVDNSKPIAVTQNLVISLGADGTARIAAEQVDNGSTDNCAIVSRILDITQFSCANLGNNTVTLTVTDASGNQASATASVTVVDDRKPRVATKDITIALGADGKASVSAEQVNNGSTDNCGIASMILDKTSFDCNNLGRNTMVLTVTDAAGNSASATAVISVVDSIKPVVRTQDITVALGADGTASIEPGQVNNGSTDNCGVMGISLDKTRFTCAESGKNTVTLTVTDVNGHTASATATVTVTDNNRPTANTRDITVFLDEAGKAVITASQLDNGSTDNCGNVSIAINRSQFSCADLGSNPVIFTATDAAGNTDTRTVSVTVKDNRAPVVITQNITVQLNSAGAASVTAVQINNGTTDNCGAVSYLLDRSDFSRADAGANTVTLTATDASGNSASATAIVTVKDTATPVVITGIASQAFCASATGTYTIPAISASGSGIVSVGYAVTGATARTGTGTNASGAFATGVSVITWTVTDASGRTYSSNATVTITELPSAAITVSNADANCNNIVLKATCSSSAASYKWICANSVFANTQHITLAQNNGDGVYSVYVTVNGCTGPATNYNFQKQQIISSYTILAMESIHLGENNNVASGSVGVMAASGKISLRRNSSVASAGSFVKARYIDRNGSNISIANAIYSPATGLSLPAMQYNTANTNQLPSKDVAQYSNTTLNGNYKNLTLKKGSQTILTGDTYGTIKVEQGAQVRFTSAVLSIDKLKIDKGPRNGYSYVRFAPNTSVKVGGSVSIGSQVYVNPDNHVVTFYLGDKKSGNDKSGQDKFTVKGGDTRVTANIYMPASKLKITGGYSYGDYGNGRGDCDRDDDDDKYYGKGSTNVYMTGWFIAEEVEAQGKNIVWNSFSCGMEPVIVKTNALTQTINNEEKSIPDETLKVTVMPNPSTTFFTLKLESRNQAPVSLRVMDANGRVVDARTKLGANSTLQVGHNYSSGTYYAELLQGTNRKVVQLIKVRG